MHEMRKSPKTVANVTKARCATAADVIDRVLDKGIVIEYHATISLSGIAALMTVDARCVVASFDTYLEYAAPLSKAGLLWG
jgi:hypothetical protein